jgi:hypothetical protein
MAAFRTGTSTFISATRCGTYLSRSATSPLVADHCFCLLDCYFRRLLIGFYVAFISPMYWA